MRTRTLALPLTLAREGPPAVRLPVLPVVPRLGNVTAHPVRALVDTGAHAVGHREWTDAVCSRPRALPVVMKR